MSINKNERKTVDGQTFTRGNTGEVKVTEEGQAIKTISVTRANLAINQGNKV